MILTGKCKEDFKKWFYDSLEKQTACNVSLQDFEKLPFSMRYGVYVDFFDANLIDVDKFMLTSMGYMSSYTLKGNCRNSAIEQRNEIYNK